MGKLSTDDAFKRLESLKARRTTWEDHWQEIGDYYNVRKNTITQTLYPGHKRRVTLYETTGVQAAETLAGALHGMLTNPSVRWFDLFTGRDEIDALDNVRLWLQKTSLHMFNALNNSNFQKAIHEFYIDLVTFGTSALLAVGHDRKILNFIPVFIGELYVDENDEGRIDEVYREQKWNAKKIVQRFGIENVGKEVRRAFEKNDTREFTIIHAVYPSMLGNKEAPTNRPYISQYLLKEEKVELELKGFREMPYIVARWAKAPGEIYGRSPAMSALADVKMLNKMDEVVIKGAEKVVDPPLQMPDDGYILPIVTKPAGLNYFRAGTQDRIQPIFNDARIDFGFQAMEDRRKRVRDAFFIDQLQLSQGPQMTATEVLQRTEEKMRLLGPMLGRQQDEFLRPLIDRIFEIMSRKNLIRKEEIPEELSDANLDVQYSSLIAKSQKAAEAQNLLRSVEMIGPIAQAKPEVLDLINGDEYVKTVFKLQNIPQDILNPDDDVQAMRQQRAQAQQKAQAQQDAQLQAQVASQLGAAG